MILYAWDVLEAKDLVNVSLLDEVHPDDLLQNLLKQVCEKLLERNLHREYSVRPEMVSSVRGAINFSETIASGSLLRRALVCDVDGLRSDSSINQIIKATLSRTLSARGLTSKSRKELEVLQRKFSFASDVRLSTNLFRRARSSLPNRVQLFAVILCELFFESLIPAEDGNETQFVAFHRDEGRMRRLFENFVRNLLRQKLGTFKVSGRSYNWKSLAGDKTVMQLVPTLNTDIVISSPEYVRIIDTKFSKHLINRNRFGQERFSTGHLYQMYAYLANWDIIDDRDLSGLLLYPSLEEERTFDAELGGFQVTWGEVDLNVDWPLIEARILALATSNVNE